MKRYLLSLLFSLIFVLSIAQKTTVKGIFYLKDGSHCQGEIIDNRKIDKTIHIQIDEDTALKVPRKNVRRILKYSPNRFLLDKRRAFKNKGYIYSINIGLNLHYIFSSVSAHAKMNYFVKPKLAIGAGLGYDSFELPQIRKI